MNSNWAGNIRFSTDLVVYPETVGELCEVVAAASKLRPLGSRHCFNTIADSPVAQVSLERMKRVVSLDERARTVTVEAGMRYGDLCLWLHERGYALHNLASLPHISIVGACATATHGSGVANGNLATAVAALEFVRADGELVVLSREAADAGFAGAIVGIGGLGVVTRLTLNVQPAFDMTQHVYLELPLSVLDEHFDEIVSSGYSVSLFTDWQTDHVNQAWIKKKTGTDVGAEESPEFFGAHLAMSDEHPIRNHSAINCTKQMGVPGPWYSRLPHFRMDFTPSSGKELQSEYFVPLENARDVVGVLQKLGDQLAPLLMISEIRTIDADDLWMSPCYHRPCASFHFTWEQDWDSLKHLLPVIEEELEPFEARPHWGKLFTMSPRRLRSLYEKMPDFRALAQEYDPEGKFRNAFLEDYIFGG